MFAGKRTTFHADLRVGDEVRRDSVIQDVTIKQGRTGQMVFVTVKTDITSPRGLAITEEQDYRLPRKPRPAARRRSRRSRRRERRCGAAW